MLVTLIQKDIAVFSQQRARSVGILSARSLPAALAIIELIKAGILYVILDPDWPRDYRAFILEDAGVEALWYDRGIFSHRDFDRSLCCLSLPEATEHSHAFTSIDTESILARLWQEPDRVLCILYTSGTTGRPKGIPITVSNELSGIATLVGELSLSPKDRIAHAADLTFDVASTEILMAWYSGATLVVCPPPKNRFPVAWIQEQAITVWFSVPTVISFSRRLGLLQKACMPSLRLSLFAGEALYVEDALAWQAAASHSTLYNLYGPTETDVCTGYAFDPHNPHGDVLPIGEPLSGQVVVLVDEQGRRVAPGEIGELWISGTQVVSGYLNRPALTRERFTAWRGDENPDRLWYHTGDLAQYDDKGQLHYRGRLDHQVKIRGHRVECQAVECVLRRCIEGEGVVLVDDRTPFKRLLAFVVLENPHSSKDIVKKMAEQLPVYMLPEKVIACPAIPLTSRGKIDRVQLLQFSEQELRTPV